MDLDLAVAGLDTSLLYVRLDGGSSLCLLAKPLWTAGDILQAGCTSG